VINTLISRKRYAVLALRKNLDELYKLPGVPMRAIRERGTGRKNVRRSTSLRLMVLNRDRLCEELTLRSTEETQRSTEIFLCVTL
jgi:hypothetical protein